MSCGELTVTRARSNLTPYILEGGNTRTRIPEEHYVVPTKSFTKLKITTPIFLLKQLEVITYYYQIVRLHAQNIRILRIYMESFTGCGPVDLHEKLKIMVHTFGDAMHIG